jgi:integrase
VAPGRRQPRQPDVSTRDQARDFKHDLLAQVARGTWVDPRLAAITVSMVRRWQNELRGKVGHDTVMACRSLLNRILQAAEDDRRIAANPVRKVPAPKPPVDADARLGRAKRRAYTPEEFGHLLRYTRPFYRDHFIAMVGTGMRPGELLGLRAARVDLANRRLGVREVRYEAGKLGRGYKDRSKSPTSIRPVPLAAPVAEVITRRLPKDCPPDALVFTGPGRGNGVPAGTRTELTRDNLRRAYRIALAKADRPGRPARLHPHQSPASAA